jgi:hypothetical protein
MKTAVALATETQNPEMKTNYMDNYMRCGAAEVRQYVV